MSKSIKLLFFDNIQCPVQPRFQSYQSKPQCSLRQREALKFSFPELFSTVLYMDPQNSWKSHLLNYKTEKHGDTEVALSKGKAVSHLGLGEENLSQEDNGSSPTAIKLCLPGSFMGSKHSEWDQLSVDPTINFFDAPYLVNNRKTEDSKDRQCRITRLHVDPKKPYEAVWVLIYSIIKRPSSSMERSYGQWC